MRSAFSGIVFFAVTFSTPTATFAREKMVVFPKAAVLFSARWERGPFLKRVNGVPVYAYDAAEAERVCREIDASHLVWHYVSKGSALALEEKKQGRGVNCALPAVVGGLYKNALAAACRNKHGQPVEKEKGSYYPDTNTNAFRQIVSEYLHKAKAAGCESLQQDNPMFMVSRRSLGCYEEKSKEEVLGYVKEYYKWLDRRVRLIFGKKIPLTYNKKFCRQAAEDCLRNDIAEFFDGAIAEVEEGQNNPYSLLNTLVNVNREEFELSTATTLVSRSLEANRRHIASVYALGGNPLFPWDVYIGPDKPRYYGEISDYIDYFRLVQDNKSLFNGHFLIDAYANGVGGKADFRKGLVLREADKAHLLIALRGHGGGERVLHIVNWKQEKRAITVSLPFSAFDNVPKRATVYRPDGKSTKVAVVRGKDEVSVKVPAVDVWAVVSFD